MDNATINGLTAFENHTQWKDVKDVCRRLREGGYQALLAGGCVRDLLMGRSPHDFDVATDATPDQVEDLFPNSIAVGKAFGVIVVPFDGFQIEVATFREDLEYKDGRRPEGVKFSSAKADSQRRDFTINALFYDPETGQVIDYVDGQADIGRKIIRTVGAPNQRFDEDKLRILRAIRFSAQLGFDIEAATLQAIEDRASEVSVVSLERIRDELMKLLLSPKRRRGLDLLLSTRVLESVLPELAANVLQERDGWLEAFERVENGEDETTLLALFLWPAYQNEKSFRAGLKNLRLENQISERLVSIFKNLPHVLEPSKVRAGELAFLLTKSFAPALLAIADCLARANALKHELDDRTKWNIALAAARPDGHTTVEPFVSGKDVLNWGLKPGPRVGELINESFLLQLENKIKTRDDAEAWIRSQV